MTGKIIRQKLISREDLRANPDRLYVFGDNLEGHGLGGQAGAMRGEPNAVGVPTKVGPSMIDSSFFNDDDLSLPYVRRRIDEAFARIDQHFYDGGTVVIPADGLGTGLAQLAVRAPKIYAYIERRIVALETPPSRQRSYYTDVGDFHRKFELPHDGDAQALHLLGSDEFAYRFKFMLEELAEYADAHGAEAVAEATCVLRAQIDDLATSMTVDDIDLAGALDALVDLTYVAAGTAHFHHFPFDEAWDEVHRANLAKERGATLARGHALDVRKPPGWEPPAIDEIIEARRAAVEAVKC